MGERMTLSPAPGSESQLLHLPVRLPAVLSRASYLNLWPVPHSYNGYDAVFVPHRIVVKEINSLTHLDHCLAHECSTESMFAERMMVALGLLYPFPRLQYLTSPQYTLHSVC